MAPRLLTCFKVGRGVEPSRHITPDISPEEQRRGGAVMVELFSSQGCATSPAAELVLSRLGRGDFQLEVPVVVLGFHVDYWDYMGWKDPFGSNQWTVRQKNYVEALGLDTLLTPQIVVQGVSCCVGNDETALIQAIGHAPRYPAPSFQATFTKPTLDSLQVSLTIAMRSKVDDSNGVNVMVALYECSLVTDCPRGENKGRVISNDYVVRKLEKLCTIKEISPKKTVTGTVTFDLGGFNCSKCGLAVFIQNSSHQILGSQSFQLPDDI